MNNIAQGIKYDYRHITALIASAVVAFLFLCHNVLGSTFYAAIGLSILGISFFVFDIRHLFAMVAFLTPLMSIVRFSNSDLVIVSYFVFIISIRYIMMCLMKYNGKITMPASVVMLAITILITTMVYFDTALFNKAIRSIFFFLFIFLFYTEIRDDGNYKWILINNFIYGSVMNFLLSIAECFYKNIDIFNTLTGYRQDRNGFATIMVVAAILALLQYIDMPKRKINLVCFAVLLFAGILSRSRTFILVVCITFVYFLFTGLNKKYTKTIMALIVFIAIVFLIFGNSILDAVSPVIDRFFDDDVATGNGRLEAWQYYLTRLVANPISFLFGSGTASRTVGDSISHVEHNLYIECIYTLGVCGTIAFIVVISNLNRIINKPNGEKKYNAIGYSALLALALFYLSLSNLMATDLDVMIFLSILLPNLMYTDLNDNNYESVLVYE